MPITAPGPDPLLASLMFCTFLEADKAGDLLNKPDVRLECQLPDSTFLRFLMSTSAGLSPERLHVHFDWKKKFRDGKEPVPNSTKEELEREFAKLSAEKIPAFVRGVYRIPKEQRPQKGLIPSVSVTTEIGGETAALTGAIVSFKDTNYDELRWETNDDGGLEVQLDAYWIFNTRDFLVTAQKHLRAGLNKIVLGIPPEQANV